MCAEKNAPESNTGLANISLPLRESSCLPLAVGNHKHYSSRQDQRTVPGSEIIRLWSEGSRRNSLQVSRSKLGRLFFWHSSVTMWTAF